MLTPRTVRGALHAAHWRRVREYCTAHLSEKITLATTFDWVMVRRADVPSVVDAFREFNLINNCTADTSLWEQSQALENLVLDDDCYAVCWTQTSVTDAWYMPTDDGEDSRMYDLSRDNKHWFLNIDEP